MPARTGFTAGNTKRSGLFPPFAAVPPLSLGAFRLLFSPGQSAAMVPLEPPPCAVFQQAFLERRRRSHSAPVSLSLSPRCIFFLFCFVNFPSIPRTKPPPHPPSSPGLRCHWGGLGGGGASCFFSSGRAPRGARSGARTVPPAARVRLRGRSAGRERSGRASSRTSRLVRSVKDPGRRGEGSGGAEPRPGEAAGLGRAVSGLHARSSGPGAPHPRGDLTPRAPPPPPPRTHTPPPPRSTALSGQPGVSRLTGLPSPGRPCGLTLGGAGRGTKRNGRRGSAGPRRLRRARGSPSAPGAAGAGGAGERRP